MKNKIDLSKIAIKETPKKTIRANFEGSDKNYTIRALNDGEKTNFTSLVADSINAYRVRNLYVCLLSCGLDIPQEHAAVLFDRVNPEAIRVGEEIYKLSEIFEEAKDEEKEEAEKNSVQEAESTGQ